MLYPIRDIEIGNVRVEIDAIPDDIPTRELVEEWDVDSEEVLHKVETGLLVHFAVRVTVEIYHMGYLPEEVGTAYLGGCIYQDFEDFRQSPYLQDLVQDAIHRARTTIEEQKKKEEFAILQDIGHTVKALLRPSGHILHVTEGQVKTRGMPAPLDSVFSSWDDLLTAAGQENVVPVNPSNMKNAGA